VGLVPTLGVGLVPILHKFKSLLAFMVPTVMLLSMMNLWDKPTGYRDLR
jgi:hypothetical protein